MRHRAQNLALAVLVVGAFAACKADEGPAQSGLSKKERAELKKEIKDELTQEIRDDLKRELLRELVPPSRTILAKGDKPARDAVPLPSANPSKPVDADRPTRDRPVPVEEKAPRVADPPEVRPTDSPEPPPMPSAPDADMELTRIQVAEAVEKRAPVNPGGRFKVSIGKLWAFAIVKNRADDAKIVFEWVQGGRDGRVRSRAKLKVGHSTRGWRTWATMNVGPRSAGKWHVRVLDPNGRVLGGADFTLTP